DAISYVAELTSQPDALAMMSQQMDDSRVTYSTYKLCKDLLDLMHHSSQYEEVYGKVPLYAKLFVK
ncbi:diglucosyl diacylglycerol synthase, partial [Staphylococcus arlettae]